MPAREEAGAFGMVDRLETRAAYGRSIRERAQCLLDAHGPEAWTQALEAAQEPGIAAAERSFWEAVAARIARQLGQRAPLSVA
jgi:hypothetical protein